MKLIDYLLPEQILVNVKARDKWEVFDLLLETLFKGPAFRDQTDVSRGEIKRMLVEREEELTSGVGSGVALPHARVPNYRGLGVAIAILSDDLEYGALDGQPVRIVCLILASQDEPTLALKLFARLSRLLSDRAVRGYFHTVTEPMQVYEYINSRKIGIGKSLTARDVMRKPVIHIRPDTPLREVASLMSQHKLESTTVEDDEQHILGEITCDALFQYGMPDFFNQLQSVKFIKHFDPFEKYFADESDHVAADVMRSDYVSVDPSATMMEIVFALAVEKHLKVYVVEEGRRVGTIDRADVLGRILNF